MRNIITCTRPAEDCISKTEKGKCVALQDPVTKRNCPFFRSVSEMSYDEIKEYRVAYMGEGRKNRRGGELIG